MSNDAEQNRIKAEVIIIIKIHTFNASSGLFLSNRIFAFPYLL